MRKLLILAIACWSIGIAKAQSADDSIRTVLKLQVDTWNNGDIERFMTTYWKSDSLMFVGKNGPTYGWQNTLNNYKKSYDTPEKMGKLKFDILQIRMLAPDCYFVLGKWHLTRSVGDVGGAYTLLFKRFKDGWKIIADHSS